jgi:malonyl-ACP decarboxylase
MRDGGEVVITGIGVCTAIGAGVEAFAEALRRGDCVASSGGAPRISDFEFASDRVSPRTRQAARRAPLSTQVSLAVALEAWQHACLFDDSPYAPEDAGLIVAGQNLSLNYAYELAARYRDRLDYVPASHAVNFMDTSQVGFISEALDIRGEGFTIGGASASGNTGLIAGLRQVASGHSAVCAVVGAMTELSPLEIQSLSTVGAMALDGVCRPFDRDRSGFVYAQGSACLILENAKGARRRGQPILGILRGGAQCLDANRSTDPSPEGEVRVMQNALADAGVAPSDIDYVNTHGTASAVGDPIEFDALREVFGAHFPDVWLNSTKALTGHCLTAAGVVEAAATLIQMNDGFLHPTCGLEHPLGEGGRFVGPASVEAKCRFALSNGFGFGGINTAIVIERV